MKTMEQEYLTRETAKQADISKYKFYKYIHENEMERVSRGVYTSQDTWVDELYILHRRCSQAVFSHDEAFYYHGLSEREPLIPTLTMYSGYNSSRLTDRDVCKVYTVKKELLNVGKIIVKDYCENEIQCMI